MVSAQARIEGYRTGYPEFLSVTYEQPNFTYDVSLLNSMQAYAL